MNTKELEDIIRQQAGNNIFSVKFIKKDGTLRQMTCLLGVKRGITGKGMSYNPREYGLLTVCDVQAAKEELGFRNINLETLQEIKINGTKYSRKGEVFEVHE